MGKRIAVAVLALCFVLTGISYAGDARTTGEKAKSFWQKLFNYPANVTNETAGVVTDAVTGTTNVVTKQVKTVGQVTSGEFEKTPNLVTDPLVGTAEATKKAVEGTVAVPSKAAKE